LKPAKTLVLLSCTTHTLKLGALFSYIIWQ